MRDRPPRASPQHKLEWPGGVVPEWAKPAQNNKRRGKNRGERQGGSSPSKRERLQKVMAQSGHGSRRNIEILIAQGHLTINGQLAKLGDSVGPGDKVKLDGRLLHLRFGDPLPRVLMYHKPAGEIVSRDDPEKRPTVFDKLPRVNNGRWVSVGRLDFNTEGLLIFTTSGELANRLTHPRFEVEREYAVRVMGELTEEQRTKLLQGVDIDGELAKFDSIEDRGGEGANHWYHVILREGKNREVRRMMEAVGLMVSRLMRVRFGATELPSHVKRGMIREMEEEQVQELLAFAGMNEPAPGETEKDEDAEDELDNIGNRAPDPSRDPREREFHADDDVGNRVIPENHANRVIVEDNVGNRGTYGEGHVPPQNKPRRPQGGKPFGFKKHGGGGHRGDNDNRGNTIGPPQGQHGRGAHGAGFGQGHGQGQGQGHGQGQPHGQGKKHRHRPHNKPKMQGQGGQGAQGQPHVQGQPHAQGQPQQHGAGTPGTPSAPGQGKRHRRNKNRNRHRGGSQTPPTTTTPT
ncbi:MAG TPA: pseudouridine synthase [Usitatibacter sp.]|nr:pseudouridine synthase [Usitatibacter sp.]